jgi:hypothetical protein
MATYEREWARFRRLRWIGFCALGLLCLSVVVFFTAMPRSSAASWIRPANDLFFVLGLGWLYCVIRLELFQCPRCGERYFYRNTLMDRSPFRRRCAHCELALFSIAEQSVRAIAGIIFGERRRESMVWINQLHFETAHPRVAQPHR